MKTHKLLLTMLACLLMASPALAFNAMPVPKDIYEWVQSSSRINYYFNRQQLSYAVGKDGKIDMTRLKVPVLKSYDNLQAEDVLQKRRWREQNVYGFEDLSGEADYVTIDLAKSVVHVNAVELLDSHMWTLERSEPNRAVDLRRLSAKSREAIFYGAIIEYEAKHRLEIVAQTKGELTAADRKLIEQLKKDAAKSDEGEGKPKKKRRKRRKAEAEEGAEQ